MTELERARAHLRKRQRVLDMVRGMSEPPSDVLADVENGVLAALSWVWEEQQAEQLVWTARTTEDGLLAFGRFPAGRKVA